MGLYQRGPLTLFAYVLPYFFTLSCETMPNARANLGFDELFIPPPCINLDDNTKKLSFGTLNLFALESSTPEIIFFGA